MVNFPLPSSHPVPLSHHASSFPNSTTNSAACQACGHQVPLGHQASNFPNSTTNSAASQACGHVSQWSITSKIKAYKPVHLSIIVRIITSRIRENYIRSAGCVNRWSTTEKKMVWKPFDLSLIIWMRTPSSRILANYGPVTVLIYGQ
jgi:hypothetical protein